MRPENQSRNDSPRKPQTTARRTLVASAAWSLPVIATAVAAPASSASTCVPTRVDRRVEVPASATTNPTFGPRTAETLVVPDGVTLITFTVLGGGGGAGSHQSVGTGTGGGAGDLVTGVLAVTPGSTLTLIAANGGIGPASLNQGIVTGGGGFGNGGHTAGATGSTTLTGGSGGGGSAILVDDTPAVVAGGGGGLGCVLARPDTGWTITGGSGGAARTDGQDATINRAQLAGPEVAHGGGGASGAAPGQPRGTNASNGTTDNGWRRTIGTAGIAPSGGGHGGGGVLSAAYSIGSQGTLQVSSAGGGGGYAGGASGTVRARVYDFTTTPYQYALAGPGGGGSSYTSAEVMGAEFTTGTNGAQDGARHPGYVEISYDIPC